MPSPPSSPSSSSLLDALDSDLDLDTDPSLVPYRAQRLQQLHAEFALAKQLRAQSHGTYSEMGDEKALMDVVTGTEWCVVHFFKPGFQRCAVMDAHLEILAPPHIQTRFLRINVENAPFLVTKLQIQVLPCVIAFVGGISVDRIVGFEGLGGGLGSGLGSGAGSGSSSHPEITNTFSTKSLESRLLAAGVLAGEKTLNGGGSGGTSGKNYGKGEKVRRVEEDDDDDEWD